MFGNLSKRKSQFLEKSSFLREYLWKYQKWVIIGLAALIIVDGLDILPPYLLKRAVDVTVAQDSKKLFTIAFIYLFLSLLQAFCRYAWRMYLIRASFYAGRDIRKKFAKHIFNLSLSFFNRNSLGNLMSLSTNDTESIRLAMGSGILVLVDALFFLTTVPVAMLFLSPKLTLMSCIPLPMIPYFVVKHERLMNKRFHEVQATFGKISDIAQESMNGIQVIKSFAKEDTQLKRMRKIGEIYIQQNLRLSRIQSGIGPIMDFSMSLGVVILLFVGGSTLIQGQEKSFTLGTFVAFQQYIQKMVWPMAALGMAINFYQRAITSSERLKTVFQEKSDLPEGHLSCLPLSHKTMGKIEFRNLSFTFPNSQKKILDSVTFTIEPGENVAFIGIVGSGKSTLLSLIPKLYPVSRGMLWIDGIDLVDWPIERVRKEVGYVSQDVFLFSETIFENIAFGLCDWNESSGLRERVQEASELAGIHEEISGLKEKYQTLLGENGTNLSGGQRQRLTIARAIAKHPCFLILDNALSSVDPHTEEKILENLKNRPNRNTELISTHRISTIQEANRVIVLQEGKVIQIGSHAELIKCKNTPYWNYFEKQRLKEDLENYQAELELHQS